MCSKPAPSFPPASVGLSFRRLLLAAVVLILMVADARAALQVRVEGIEEPLLGNVLALLTLQRERETSGLGEGHVRRYFRRAPAEIRKALEPYGYYAVQMDARLEESGGDWLAWFRIEPGEPLRYRTVTVSLIGAGEQDAVLNEALTGFPLQQGQVAVHSDYEAAKAGLQKLAIEQGYLDAVYQRHELRIDPAAGYAEVQLLLDSGPQYRFGELVFAPGKLSEELLRRYVTFKPGQPYSYRRLLDLQRALEDSDYFAQVEVVPLSEQAQGAVVPVQVDLETHKRNKYSVGLGFGTDTGLRGLLGWENRRVNRYGHRMGASLRGSEIGSELKANYSLPLANPRSDRLEFTAGIVDEDTDTTDSTLHKFAIGRRVARGRWRETLSLSYEREDYNVGLTDESTSLLIPGISYSQVRADNRLVANRGWRLQFDLRGAAEQLLSDTSFVQSELRGKWIHGLGERGRIITRAEAGTTWIDEDNLLPVSVRFFAGGDQSVRGYDYQELGPRDASGDVVGGRHRVFGSLEYEHRIKGNWGLAAFVDTGNAFDSFSDGLETGAGIGLRWKSPIGMVRIDVASAVSQDNGLRLHFTLGPDL
ncbi:MAG: autotransporter assembly complex protein TamA [Gammaproteobacteria bacterium]|nr:autotransporter assembly complex protein TamA [Gammaproteobacteria bacterium]